MSHAGATAQVNLDSLVRPDQRDLWLEGLTFEGNTNVVAHTCVSTAYGSCQVYGALLLSSAEATLDDVRIHDNDTRLESTSTGKASMSALPLYLSTVSGDIRGAPA